MPTALITLDYHKCRPDRCNHGYCLAAPSCPLGIIQQEEPYELPMANSSVCRGCAKCVAACPLQAIDLS